jgi:hypothetical protein
MEQLITVAEVWGKAIVLHSVGVQLNQLYVLTEIPAVFQVFQNQATKWNILQSKLILIVLSKYERCMW